MYPWDILQIEPTAEARAIKRAYAKQLKQNRPDEKPQAFQQLHDAYKQALAWAEQQQETSPPPAMAEWGTSIPDPAPEPEPELIAGPTNTPPPSHDTFVSDPEPDATLQQASWSVQLTPTPPPPVDTHPGPLSDGSAPEFSQDEQDHTLTALLEQARHRLQQTPETTQSHDWHFLTGTPLILDDTFNHRLGQALFALLSEHYQSVQPAVDASVIRYLNGLFNWEGQRRWLNEEFGEDACDNIFRILDDTPLAQEAIKAVRGGQAILPNAKKPPEVPPENVAMGGYSLRILAFAMDVFLIIICAIFVVEALQGIIDNSDESGAPLAMILAVPLYLFMALIMESTPMQSTPGKFMLGMRVTNRRLQRLHPLHNVGRIIAFCLTGILWKVIFIVNAFMKGHLLHDRISRSYVILYRKSP